MGPSVDGGGSAGVKMGQMMSAQMTMGSRESDEWNSQVQAQQQAQQQQQQRGWARPYQ